jgi:hypothetical protein
MNLDIMKEGGTAIVLILGKKNVLTTIESTSIFLTTDHGQ